MDKLINKQIIIIDDNKTYCDIVMEQAATLGMKANAFLRVESAWVWQLGNQRLDIIITDLDIPDQAGIELIRDHTSIISFVIFLLINDGYQQCTESH